MALRSQDVENIPNVENVVPGDAKRILRPRVNPGIPKRNALSVINNVPLAKTAKVQGVAIKKPLASQVLKQNVQPSNSFIPKPTVSGTSFQIFSDNQEAPKEKLEVDTIPCNRIKLYKPDPVPLSESIITDEESSFEDESSPMVLEDNAADESGTYNFQNKEVLFTFSIYSKDIYVYLRNQERKFRPNPNYVQKQPELTMSMRSILVDWLVEVVDEYKMHTETLYLAVSYLDRFLSCMSVLKAKLQLVGTACMFIASKYEEIYPPELKHFVYITDDSYSKRQILRMEHLILKVLAFDLTVPTAYYFLHHLCTVGEVPKRTRLLAQYICELSLLESEPFLQFLPSELACASVCLANFTLDQEPWPLALKETTGYTLENLAQCITRLHHRYSTINSFPQQAITDKYKSNKYDNVSSIEPPRQIIY